MITISDPTLWTDQDTTSLGVSSSPWSASGVSIDSRKISRGDLFIALDGPNFDGHDFVKEAEAAGAVAAMVARNGANNLELGLPVLLVDDTMCGLEGLARLARTR